MKKEIVISMIIAVILFLATGIYKYLNSVEAIFLSAIILIFSFAGGFFSKLKQFWILPLISTLVSGVYLVYLKFFYAKGEIFGYGLWIALLPLVVFIVSLILVIISFTKKKKNKRTN